MILTGVLINGAAIVAGGVLGTFGGKLMPERMKETVLAATALISIGIGVSGLGSSNNQLIPILSLVLGTIIGELLNIEAAVERLGSWLQKRFGASAASPRALLPAHWCSPWAPWLLWARWTAA